MGFLLSGITITDANIHIDLQAMISAANTGVLRATAFMGFGLNAADTKQLANFHPQDVYIRLSPMALSESQVAEYKLAFRDWIIQNAIRELVESFGQFLNGIYAAAILFQNGQKPITKELMTQIRTFTQKGEKKRVAILIKEFEFEVPSLGYIDSLVDVRNEITHASGIVRQPLIRLRWLRQQVALRSENGTDADLHLPLTEPYQVESDSSLIIKLLEGEKRFVRGERITLTPLEAQEIFMSTHIAIRTVAEAVVKKWGHSATNRTAQVEQDSG